MKKLSNFIIIVLIDILGVALIITAGLIGWVPGPGGIPLALGGLALLAINHDWAKRWLEKFKAKGLEVKDSFSKKFKK